MAELENFSKLCRLCGTLTHDQFRQFIFEAEGFLQQIPEKLKNLPVEVKQDDELPRVLCNECLRKLDDVNDFFQAIKITDIYLKQTLHSQTITIKEEPLVDMYDANACALKEPKTPHHFETVDIPSCKVEVHAIDSCMDDGTSSHSNPTDTVSLSLANMTTPSLLGHLQPALAVVQTSSFVHQSPLAQSVYLQWPVDSVAPQPSIIAPPLRTFYPCFYCKILCNSPQDVGDHIAKVHKKNPKPCAAPQTVLTKSVKVAAPNTGNASKKGQFQDSVASVDAAEANDPLQNLSLSQLRAHFFVKRRRDTDVVEDNPFFGCNICYISFPNQAILMQHEKSHAPLFQESLLQNCHSSQLQDNIKGIAHQILGSPQQWHCSECGKAAQHKEQMIIHMRIHAKNYHCNKCKSNLKSVDCTNEHCKCHAKNWSCFCKSCGRGFLTKYARRMHVAANHPIEVQEKRSILKHVCTECGKTFHKQSRLDLHYSCYHSTRTKNIFKCNECGKGYMMKGFLHKHLFKVHSISVNEPKSEKTQRTRYNTLFCDMCQKTFRNIRFLRVHITSHLLTPEERKKFPCDVCGAKFDRKYLVAKHFKNNHSNENTSCICHVCGKEFFNSDSLKAHVKLHSESKMVCEVCGKALATKQYLKQHMLSHKGARPHACHLCDSRFTQRSPLLAHLKKAHGVDGRVCRFEQTSRGIKKVVAGSSKQT